MFQIFKKVEKKLYAPIEGICVDITTVNDVTFSKKLVGDGIAFIPENNVVCAPCDGKVSSIFPTLHAFSIKRKDGLEILIHVGINTVEFNGEGFEKLININDKVSQGTPIIKFDKNYLSKEQVDMTTMMLFPDSDVKLFKHKLDERVSNQDLVLEYEE